MLLVIEIDVLAALLLHTQGDAKQVAVNIPGGICVMTDKRVAYQAFVLVREAIRERLRMDHVEQSITLRREVVAFHSEDKGFPGPWILQQFLLSLHRGLQIGLDHRKHDDHRLKGVAVHGLTGHNDAILEPAEHLLGNDNRFVHGLQNC